MACSIYLIRAPRYEDVPFEKIRLIESFLSWKRECKIGSKYAASSFEEWSGHALKELPSPEAIMYFKHFFDRKGIGDEDDTNGYKCFGIFEQMAKYTKASQFLNWLMRNVICSAKIPFHGTYEISKEQIEQLLEACNQVRRYGITHVETNVYEVNESIARVFLPILEIDGELVFPYEYKSQYAEQVIEAIKTLNEIVATTNFEKQTIYFQYR